MTFQGSWKSAYVGPKMWRFNWEIKPILMSWLLTRAALTGWPQPFNRAHRRSLLIPKMTIDLLMSCLVSIQTESICKPRASIRDMIAFTHLQTCWSLLWDQVRGSVWKHQSKALPWALSSLIYRNPRSSWSQSTEENSTSGFRNRGKRSHLTAADACQRCRLLGFIDLLEAGKMLEHRGRQSCVLITCCCQPVPPAREKRRVQALPVRIRATRALNLETLGFHTEILQQLRLVSLVSVNISISKSNIPTADFFFFFCASLMKRMLLSFLPNHAKKSIRMDESDIWFLFSW